MICFFFDGCSLNGCFLDGCFCFRNFPVVLTLFLLTLNKSVNFNIMVVVQYNEVINTISNMSIFFFIKNISAIKSTKCKTNDFHLLRSFCAREKLLPLFFSVCLILFCCFIFACDVFLRARNLFVKKNKQVWNCLDNLIVLYYFYCRYIVLSL